MTTSLCLIDGFNVLHAVLLRGERDVDWWTTDYQQRVVDWVHEGLSSWLRSHGNHQRVILVFDASREPQEPYQLSSRSVTIVYTPDADAWIVRACAEESGRMKLDQRIGYPMVVTVDRSLINRARMYGAQSMKPWHWGQGELE